MPLSKPMDKNNIITPDQLTKINKDEDILELDWNGLKLYVRKTISFSEASNFINSVMSACINEDGLCVIEAKAFAIRANVIMRYSAIELPSNIEEQYSIVYNTNLYDTIYNVINKNQINDILQSIDFYINALKKETL